MRYVHKLFPGRHAGRPAAVLTAALGLAFACSESPTEATLDGMAPQFKGKPDRGGTGPTTDPNPVTVTLNSGVYTSFGENPYDERDGCNVSTHLSGVNGNLAFSFQFQKNTRKLKPSPCTQRQVHFLIPGTTVDDDFFGRIYTNSTTLDGMPLPDGLRDLRGSPEETATTVLGSQFGDQLQLNFGQHCPFGEVDEINSDKVDVVYSADVLTDVDGDQPGWKITAVEARAFYCTGGGQTPVEVEVSGLNVDITVIDVDPAS